MTWLRATLIRCVRTGAAAALGAIGAATMFAQVEWDQVASATGLTMVITFLIALTGLPEADTPSPVERLRSDEGG